MPQYCRYCAFCIDGNALYCTSRNKVLSEQAIRRPNRCADFALSDLGDVESGRQYRPREPNSQKHSEDVPIQQMSMF